MKKRFVAVIFLFVMSFVAWAAAAQRSTTISRQTWEYVMVDIPVNASGQILRGDLNTLMQKYGMDGWELVTSTPGYLYFKRAK
jgi:opacity protein-like surface antigen